MRLSVNITPLGWVINSFIYVFVAVSFAGTPWVFWLAISASYACLLASIFAFSRSRARAKAAEVPAHIRKFHEDLYNCGHEEAQWLRAHHDVDLSGSSWAPPLHPVAKAVIDSLKEESRPAPRALPASPGYRLAPGWTMSLASDDWESVMNQCDDKITRAMAMDTLLLL